MTTPIEVDQLEAQRRADQLTECISAEIVRLVAVSGRSVVDVARDAGVPRAMFRPGGRITAGRMFAVGRVLGVEASEIMRAAEVACGDMVAP